MGEKRYGTFEQVNGAVVNDLEAENERLRALLADVLHEYFTADEIAYETCEAIKQHLNNQREQNETD